MKFDQLVEYNKINIFFFKTDVEHEAGRLVPDLFLFFEKASFDVKASGQQLSLMSFDIPQLGI